MLLLSTAYFPPIQYFSCILQYQPAVVIERHEHYVRQSYRNRCAIYAAGGLLSLVVPVVKTDKPKTPVGEVEICYHAHWQKQHFKSIESAYRRSPFYEFYIDELMPFFNRRHPYLYEFNMNIMRAVCGLINMPFSARESCRYVKPAEGIIDLRNKIHPKTDFTISDYPTSNSLKSNSLTPPRYLQVFADRHGFKPGLSILDLLFNVGPRAVELL